MHSLLAARPPRRVRPRSRTRQAASTRTLFTHCRPLGGASSPHSIGSAPAKPRPAHSHADIAHFDTGRERSARALRGARRPLVPSVPRHRCLPKLIATRFVTVFLSAEHHRIRLGVSCNAPAGGAQAGWLRRLAARRLRARPRGGRAPDEWSHRGGLSEVPKCGLSTDTASQRDKREAQPTICSRQRDRCTSLESRGARVRARFARTHAVCARRVSGLRHERARTVLGAMLRPSCWAPAPSDVKDRNMYVV